MSTSLKVVSLKTQPSKPLVCDVTFTAPNLTAETLRNIEFIATNSGTESITISNQHQEAPLHFKLKVGRKNAGGVVSLKSWGSNAFITRDLLRFLRAMTVGGDLSLSKSSEPESGPIVFPLGSSPELENTIDFPIFEPFVENVCFLQEKTKQLFTIPLDDIPFTTFSTVASLISILKSGNVTREGSDAAFVLSGDDIPESLLNDCRQKNEITFSIPYESSKVELLGQTIDLGNRSEQYTGTLNMTSEEIEQAIQTFMEEQRLPLKFSSLKVVSSFPRWQSMGEEERSNK